MASDGMDPLRQESWPPVNPWKIVLAGLAAVVLALFLQQLQSWMPGDTTARVLIPLRGLAITAGLILAGGGVSLRLRTASLEFDERVVSASLTGVAAFTALLGRFALDKEWDSIALFLGVVAFVGFAGCGLILLPRVARRVVAVLLVALHFGGIFTAIATTTVPGSTPPWASQVLWTYLYRPYLQFAYLNNAYHFYSPEPGPAQQLWFYIKFEDGGGEWLKIPQREDYATRQEYQRVLSVTENANYMEQTPPADLRMRYQSRMMAGNNYHPAIKAPPLDDESGGTPLIFQYREPNILSKQAIQSFAKHVAMTYRSEAHPNVPVETVKVYRVQHNIVPPQLMANGEWSPDNPTYFAPYYQGEFNREGKLVKPNDPFLYTAIPIMYEPKAGRRPALNRYSGNGSLNQWNLDDYDIVDYCKLHAEGHE